MAGGSLGGGIATNYLDVARSAQRGVEASADLVVSGQNEGGLSGLAKQGVGYTTGFFGSLATEQNLPSTLTMVGTMGLGEAAAAEKLGMLSKPILRTMQVGGAFTSGTSIGQGLSGKNMWTGEKLSPVERGFDLTLGAAGSALDMYGAGFNPKNLSGSFPTVSSALEGVLAPKQSVFTQQTGQLSSESGAIRLGSSPEEISSNGVKHQSSIFNRLPSDEHSELTNAITNLGKDFSHHNSDVLKDFKPTLNPTKSDQTIFSGIYDPKTNTFLTKPSGNTKLSNGESPQDLVLPLGGHGQVQQVLQQANPEIDTSKTIGFTIYYREKGKLEVAFFSRGINSRNFPKLEGYAPEEYQNQFLKTLGESTGLEVKAVPRLRLPD
jgi:hypothetical protein